MKRELLEPSEYETYICTAPKGMPSKAELKKMIEQVHPFFSPRNRTDVRKSKSHGIPYAVATVFTPERESSRSRLYTREILYLLAANPAIEIPPPDADRILTPFSAPESFDANNALNAHRLVRPLDDSLNRTMPLQSGPFLAALFATTVITLSFVFAGMRNDENPHMQAMQNTIEDASRINIGERSSFFSTAGTVFEAITGTNGGIRSFSWESGASRTAFVFSVSGCTAEQFRSRLSPDSASDAFAIPETRFDAGIPNFEGTYTTADFPAPGTGEAVNEGIVLSLCRETGIMPLSIQEGVSASCTGSLDESALPPFFASLVAAAARYGLRIDSISLAVPGRSRIAGQKCEVKLRIASSQEPDTHTRGLDPETVRKAFNISSDAGTPRASAAATANQSLPIVGKIKFDGVPYAHYSKKPGGYIVCERTSP